MRRVALGPILILALLTLPAGTAQQNVGDPAEDPHNLSWVEKGVLAVGGGGLDATQLQWLASQGFGAVADVRAEHDDGAENAHAAGLDYLYHPIDHATDIDLTDIHAFLSWADQEAAAGKPIYVHCTNGWHRAATFAIAWRMHRKGLTTDDAAAQEMALRPGTQVRAAGALLRYQAELQHQAPLAVLLESTTARPPAGGSMPVTVLVVGNGTPLARATVHYSTETRRVDARATTGPDGRATFDLAAPADATFMDFLTARASAPGFTDGADTVEIFYGISVAPPTDLALRATDAGDTIKLHISRDGGPLHARVLAVSGAWTAFLTTPALDATMPAPPARGTVTLTLASWGGGEATASVQVAGASGAGASPPAPAPVPPPAPAPKPTPAPTAAPPPPPAPTPEPTAEASSASSRDVLIAGIAAVGILGVAAGVWRVTRSRARR